MKQAKGTILMLFVLIGLKETESEFLSHYIRPDLIIENAACRVESEILLRGVSNLELWALKIVDSSSKIQSGILFGNIKDYGNFDECIDTQKNNIKGKYCLAHIQIDAIEPNLLVKNEIIDFASYGRRHVEIIHNRTLHNVPLPDTLPSFALFQSAFCIPSSCKSQDVEKMVNASLLDIGNILGLQIYSEVFEENCYTKTDQPIPWSTGEQVFLIFIISILTLAFVATVLEQNSVSKMKNPKEKSPLDSFVERGVLPFSLSRNWSILTNDVSKNTMQSLDGVRALSIYMVVICHNCISNVVVPYMNKRFIYDVRGVLRTYNMLKGIKEQKFSFFKDLVQRYVRFTLPLLVIITFYTTWFDKMGSGPTWYKSVGVNKELCEKNWFWNILYVNNNVNPTESCIAQSWYLAADMQFYIAAPIFIQLICRWPNIGKKIFAFIFFSSLLIPAAIVYFTRAAPSYAASFTDEGILKYIKWLHFSTLNRITPYMVGIALGFVLWKLKNGEDQKLSKKAVCLCWIASIFSIFAAAYGVSRFIDTSYKYNLVEIMIFTGLHKALFTLCLAWFIYACESGRSVILNNFLSCKLFSFLSKLSFSIFLTHFIVINYIDGTLRHERYFDLIQNLHVFMGSFSFSIILAIVFYLLIEAPSRSLVNSLLH
ncbi:nose resistant to fluoxetine protein 6-like isoform X2 [Neocloeon triangulifer]|uniref:nose resistant to fluoxetine protein 6-like isoform X2 n=1 Tax=Neocloeon triangulifer TaxID=2078957 RepID=UPI00286EBFD2|nr:nose resistant to fluoxetine protein 6-like isoform X2 [Neocloeon triangulifer]